MKKFKKPNFKFSRPVVAVAVIAVALVAGGAFWWLQTDWSRYAERIESDTREARSVAQDILVDEELSLNKLKSTETTLRNRAGHSCDLAYYQAWRQYVSDEAENSQATCRDLARNSEEAASSLAALINHLESEQQLAQIISDTMVTLENLEPGQYDQAAEAWQQAAAKLESFEPGDSLKESVDRLILAAASVAQAHLDLKAADASQQRPKYDDAHVNLQQAYQELSDMNQQVAESYEPLVEAVTKDLEKLRS